MIMTEHIFEEERGYGTGVSLELDDGALKPVEEVLPSADGEKIADHGRRRYEADGYDPGRIIRDPDRFHKEISPLR